MSVNAGRFLNLNTMSPHTRQMRREVTTTVQGRLHSLTDHKRSLLVREYEAFQTAIRGDSAANLYSATK